MSNPSPVIARGVPSRDTPGTQVGARQRRSERLRSAIERARLEHPRVAMDLPVRLTLPGGAVLETRTVGLSRAGFEIECRIGDRDRIFPRGQPRVPSDRTRLHVELEGVLPPGPGGSVLAAEAEAVIYRRTGQHLFRVGIQFLALGEGEARLLADLVRASPPGGRRARR